LVKPIEERLLAPLVSEEKKAFPPAVEDDFESLEGGNCDCVGEEKTRVECIYIEVGVQKDGRVEKGKTA